jgi:hypothetical protein
MAAEGARRNAVIRNVAENVMIDLEILRREPLLAHCEPRSIVSWRQTRLPSLGFSEQHALWREIRAEECWYNAHLIATHFAPHVSYVEGFVVFWDGVVPHGWNVIDGQSFDLTWERHFSSALTLPRFQLIEGAPQALAQQGYVFHPNVMTMAEQYRRRLQSGAPTTS